MTTADAFSSDYAHFTRTRITSRRISAGSQTAVKVVWGKKDSYIKKEMGIELAERVNAEFSLLPGIGHSPHLQDPERTIDDVRASLRSVGNATIVTARRAEPWQSPVDECAHLQGKKPLARIDDMDRPRLATVAFQDRHKRARG